MGLTRILDALRPAPISPQWVCEIAHFQRLPLTAMLRGALRIAVIDRADRTNSFCFSADFFGSP